MASSEHSSDIRKAFKGDFSGHSAALERVFKLNSYSELKLLFLGRVGLSGPQRGGFSAKGTICPGPSPDFSSDPPARRSCRFRLQDYTISSHSPSGIVEPEAKEGLRGVKLG